MPFTIRFEYISKSGAYNKKREGDESSAAFDFIYHIQRAWEKGVITARTFPFTCQ